MLQPQEAVVEIAFGNVNPPSKLRLGQARAAALAALVAANLPVAEYSALQVKQAVVGYGRATKAQVQAMVQRMLQLPGLPSTDAADALACAICHANAGQMASQARQQATPVAARRAGGIRRGRIR